MADATSSDLFKAWFPAYKPSARPARLRILCFPSAGSAENIFTGGYLKDKKRVSNHLVNWAQEADAEILAVQLPGREQRRSEPFMQSCKQAATHILAVVQPKIMEDVPYVIISHSCGNWVAYEFLRLARERSLQMPKMFFVSCMAAPTIADSAKPWRKNGGLAEAEMKEECAMWDVNQVVFKPDVWPMFEPLLRADFTLFDTYDHDAASVEPFDFPIHSFFANGDRRISRDMVASWKDFTSDEFTIECIHGNHLFVYDNGVRDEWFEIICDILTGEGF